MILVPRLNTSWSTYTALFLLVWLHLIINYFGVRGLALRTLNRQRLSIVWMTYRDSTATSPITSSKSLLNGTTPQATTQIPTPAAVGNSERIFDLSGFGTIRDSTGKKLGLCFIGTSLSEHLVQHQLPAYIATELLCLFEAEGYLIWFEAGCLSRSLRHVGDKAVTCFVIKRDVVLGGLLRVHISLKEGYTTRDQIKAWVHAVELCRRLTAQTKRSPTEDIDAIGAIVSAFGVVERQFSSFLDGMGYVGWDCVDCALLTGTPSVIISDLGNDSGLEDKKLR